MTTEKLDVVPLEETYTEEWLNFVRNLPVAHINFGRVPDGHDSRDYLYTDLVDSKISSTAAPGSAASGDPVEQLLTPVTSTPIEGMPNKYVARRERTGPVLDQGFTPKCVTHSGASIKSEHERKEHRRQVNFNAHEWYDYIKSHGLDPWGPDVDGTGIRYAASLAKNRGAYGDDPRSTKDDPSGKLYKIETYVRLTTIEQILEQVWKRSTVWFGIDVDDGIFYPYQLKEGGYVVAPPNANSVGGHAMVIVGFWLSRGWFLVKNSWGEGYADKGYMWYPMTHFQAYGWDAWAAIDAKDLKS